MCKHDGCIVDISVIAATSHIPAPASSSGVKLTEGPLNPPRSSQNFKNRFHWLEILEPLQSFQLFLKEHMHQRCRLESFDSDSSEA